MNKSYQTALFKRILEYLDTIAMIDTHEHLPRPQQIPLPEDISIGRLFSQSLNWDLASAGMPAKELALFLDDTNDLEPKDKWALVAPWFESVRHSSYAKTIFIAIRDLYEIEDINEQTVETIVEKMRQENQDNVTRRIFDRSGIDYALNNPFPVGTELIYRHCEETDCFMVDMHDQFAEFPIKAIEKDLNININSLDDYLQAIDTYFERYGAFASAYKIPYAYWRTLDWEEALKNDAKKVFAERLTAGKKLERDQMKILEDYILGYLGEKCSEYGLRMKFHCGLQAYNGNIIEHSRAALLNRLFLKYTNTMFDIYHLSYPYWEEATTLVKMFPNVTINFCFAWNINATASRQAFSGMLDAVPLNKIHGFGGDYSFIEGTYGSAVLTKQEIARVLAEKVEEGGLNEKAALRIGKIILRDNALNNFGLKERRRRLEEWVCKKKEAKKTTKEKQKKK